MNGLRPFVPMWRNASLDGLIFRFATSGICLVQCQPNRHECPHSAQTQSLADIEQAFMAVQSKAAPIMRAPYRIGFEIVHRNNDNTRLVGIFVFRVNKDLYYAPVFFINGNIKGTDLFYRHTTKSFVPATESWVEYLISLSETSEGKGVPISERINTRCQMNLQAIVSPPDTMMARKYASAAWEEMKSAAVTELSKDSILRKFVTEHGGFNAIKKMASAAQNDPEFANALFLSSDPESYMSALDAYKAPELPAPLLTLHQNLLKNASVKSASAADLHKGYLFEDNRPKEAVNEVIYDANERTLQPVTQPGIYHVLVVDGSTHRMICSYHRDLLSAKRQLNPSDDATEFGGSHTGMPYETTQHGLRSVLPFVVIDLDDHKSRFIDLLPTART
jgi:hypothetical protein